MQVLAATAGPAVCKFDYFFHPRPCKGSISWLIRILAVDSKYSIVGSDKTVSISMRHSFHLSVHVISIVFIQL